jgi:hypothetical protein
MAITCTDKEKLSISAFIHQRDVIYRMIDLINDLEARIEILENE